MRFLKLTSLAPLFVLVLASCGGALDITLGGTVTGLPMDTSVVLTNNSNGDTVTVSYNATDNTFEFPTSVPENTNYNVVATTSPTGYICSVTNGVGVTGSSDITNITVNCVAGTSIPVPVYASVVGLAAGNSLLLVLNGDAVHNALTVSPPLVTMLAFPLPQLANTPFVVSIPAGQPTGPTAQTCTVQTSGSGSIPTTGVSPPPAIVSCTTP